jgi:glycosyltransferase involved in cell wall biosynthesis
MPVYNGEKYIEEAIRSNLAQTYEDFYLYIADNASMDRTEEICRDFASADKRIKYIRNKHNLGASKNYSICFEPSKSEYYRWSNADDVIDRTLIEQCIKFLDENDDYVLAYGKTKIIDLDGNLIEYYDDKLNLEQESACDRFMSFRENIGLSNVLYGLMRRRPLSKTALLGNYTASDINLIGELTLYGKYKELDDYLFSRRMHPEASSWDRGDSDRQKEFWDPNKKNFGFDKTRSSYEYYKCVARAPISYYEKIRLFNYISRSVYRNKREILHEVMNFRF